MTELNQVLNEIAQDIKELFKRIDDVDLTGSVPVGASVPAAGTLYNHLEDNGAAWISVSDLNLDNDARLYFGAAQENSLRRVSASNRLEIAGEDWYFNGPSVGIGVTPSAILETQEAGAAQVRFTSAGAAQVVRMALADSGQEWQVRKDTDDNLILFDATATSSPLTIENAAPSNSIYIKDNGAVGIRDSTIANAVGLSVLWIAGDADVTAQFGSSNVANNQNTIEAFTFSGTAIHGQTASGIGVYAYATTGTALEVNLVGAGVVADFQDSGSSVLTIQDGGNILLGSTATLDLNGIADALILDTDADTTISAPTDDQIDFEVGGSDKMMLDSTGLGIGVGVTTAVDLHVYDAAANAQIRVERGDTPVRASVDALVDKTRFGSNTNHPVNFLVNNTAKMVIDTSGHVGIGTTSPATSALLDLTSTTGALLVSRMTTAQRNALTAVDGMIIYNSSTSAFNFRENGAWVTGSGLA